MPNDEKANANISRQLLASELRQRIFLHNSFTKFERMYLVERWRTLNLPTIPFTFVSRGKTAFLNLYDASINSKHIRGSLRILLLQEILLLISFSQSRKDDAINLSDLVNGPAGKRDKTLLVHIKGYEILNDNPKQIIARAKKKIQSHYDIKTAEFYNMLIDCLIIKISKRTYVNIAFISHLFIHNNYVHISLFNATLIKANLDIIKESSRKALLTLDKLNALYPNESLPFYNNLRYLLSLLQDESTFKTLRSGR